MAEEKGLKIDMVQYEEAKKQSQVNKLFSISSAVFKNPNFLN